MDALRYFLNPHFSVFILLCIALLVFLRRRLPREDFNTLVVGVLAAFFLAEGLCRIIGIGNPRVAEWKEEKIHGANAPYAYKPNTRLIYRYPDNPRGYFDENNEVTGTINSRGFRGTSVDLAKEKGKVRLAFLGDSFTLGIGVRDEDTLPIHVQADLSKDYKNIEVLNFGVTGANTREEVNLLERYALRFKPDLVVIVLFLNDADRIGTVRFLSRANFFARVRKHSYFINVLVGSIERIVLSGRMIRHYEEGFSDSSDGYKQIKSSLRKGQSLSQKYRFTLVVTLYPVLYQLDDKYPFANIHHNIAGFCSDENIPFVDLLKAFRGKRDREMWVHPTDQHPNEEAHRLAARQLSGYLLKEGLIDKASGHSGP